MAAANAELLASACVLVILDSVELKHLRHFVAVAEEGNISRAAQKVFLTQPALSRQIKALEEEIGQCLLERHAHSIRLTPTGEILAREARELLQHADQVLERVRATTHGPKLRIGYAPSLAGGLLAGALEHFTRTHPEVRLELLDLSTQEMLARLDDDTLEVAITVRPAKSALGRKWVTLWQTEFRLATSAQHRLAQKDQITRAEIAREPLLIYCQRDYPEYWEMLSNWFRADRHHPRIAGEYDSVDSLMAAVEAGLGVAVIVHRNDRPVSQRVRLGILVESPPTVCIAAGFHPQKLHHQTIADFVAALCRAAKA